MPKCKILTKSLEKVLEFNDHDLGRYRSLCLDHLLGVSRPKDERCAIIERIETIHSELKRRKVEINGQ